MRHQRPKRRYPFTTGQSRLVEILADILRSALVWDEGVSELLVDSNPIPETRIDGLFAEYKLSSQPKHGPPSLTAAEDNHGNYSITSE